MKRLKHVTLAFGLALDVLPSAQDADTTPNIVESHNPANPPADLSAFRLLGHYPTLPRNDDDRG
jgi:hypothetical protein